MRFTRQRRVKGGGEEKWGRGCRGLEGAELGEGWRGEVRMVVWADGWLKRRTSSAE
ncbi:MAG: hypothetical protein ACKERG_03285 [Candidatus Hodgkinia cicadicola]